MWLSAFVRTSLCPRKTLGAFVFIFSFLSNKSFFVWLSTFPAFILVSLFQPKNSSRFFRRLRSPGRSPFVFAFEAFEAPLPLRSLRSPSSSPFEAFEAFEGEDEAPSSSASKPSKPPLPSFSAFEAFEEALSQAHFLVTFFLFFVFKPPKAFSCGCLLLYADKPCLETPSASSLRNPLLFVLRLRSLRRSFKSDLFLAFFFSLFFVLAPKKAFSCGCLLLYGQVFALERR